MFRGSIARHFPSLSTLRSRPRGTTTQDSLPAAGQRYRAGMVTRWVPKDRFLVTSCFQSPVLRVKQDAIAEVARLWTYGPANGRSELWQVRLRRPIPVAEVA